MRINIRGHDVKLEDEEGDTILITTDQLIEMVRILNAATNQDGAFFFEFLEFKV